MRGDGYADEEVWYCFTKDARRWDRGISSSSGRALEDGVRFNGVYGERVREVDEGRDWSIVSRWEMRVFVVGKGGAYGERWGKVVDGMSSSMAVWVRGVDGMRWVR